MSSWFSEKAAQVNTWVNQGPRLAGTQQRTVEEQVVDLETQARRVTSPTAALEIVGKWVERIDGGYGTYELVGGQHLSYYQVFLRSRAFEVFLDVCARAPSVREWLRGHSGTDAKALQQLAERVLLPGTLVIWPSLLEILLASSAEAGDENSASERLPLSGEPRCSHWARRAVMLLKRRWQHEALPSVLKGFDRRLASLVGNSGKTSEVSGGSDHLLIPTMTNRMSKNGIRMALARDQLQRCSTEAARLRAQLNLVCDACLHVATFARTGGSSDAMAKEVEKLLFDADAMLSSLDAHVKEKSNEQDVFKQKLGELGAPIQEKISEIRDTLSSFSDKRSQLQEERSGLARRLEEVDMHLEQLDQAKAACQKEEKQLRMKLRDSTNHYEERISTSFIQQKHLAEEKTRAVTCKQCAHAALDVLQREDRRFSGEVSDQFRKRKEAVRQICTQYVRRERLRFEAAVDCFEAGEAAEDGSSKGSSAKAIAIAEEAWCNTQQALQRCGELVGDLDGVASVQSAFSPSSSSTASAGNETAAEEVQRFFAQALQEGRHCADCGLNDADWASVSFGTYLCLDCAGRHRGLGVHVSFVRSTTMDKWTRDQLRRMQMGGTAKFLKFLKGYPRLYGPPQSAADVSARYSSRAANYYRRSLDNLCEGNDSNMDLGEPPATEEGHLPCEIAPVGSSIQSSLPGKSEVSSDSEVVAESLAKERASFEAVYRRHQHKLGDSSKLSASLVTSNNTSQGDPCEAKVDVPISAFIQLQPAAASLSSACKQVPPSQADEGAHLLDLANDSVEEVAVSDNTGSVIESDVHTDWPSGPETLRSEEEVSPENCGVQQTAARRLASEEVVDEAGSSRETSVFQIGEMAPLNFQDGDEGDSQEDDNLATDEQIDVFS